MEAKITLAALIAAPTTPRRRVGLLACFWSAMAPVASALDTTVDFRDSRQTAHSASEAFTTYSRRESITARQTTAVGSPLTLSLRFRLLREKAGGDAGGVDQESRRRTYQPDVVLTYRQGSFSAGVQGNWLERRSEGASGLAPEEHRNEIGGWLSAPLPRGGLIGAQATRTASESEGVIGPSTEQKQTKAFLNAQQPLGGTWSFEYGFSGNSSDLISRDTRRTLLTNSFEIRGGPSLADGRLDTWFLGRSQLFSQKVEAGVSGRRTLLRTPLFGGVTLDDTPETLDPLEDDPLFVPALYDSDLESPTTIRLGDDAPPVREFGGDYRNILFDFGDPQAFDSAILYVDQRLINANLFQWRVFVTDDPDGREWRELGPSEATVQYAEFGTVLQGWEVRFATGVSGRFLKLVDAKLGPTIPELRVTEFEVFIREDVEAEETRERSQDHRAEARLGYDVTDALRIGYDTRLRTRRFEDSSRDVDDTSHGFYSSQALGSYLLSGRIDLHRVWSETRRNTDSRSYQLSASRRPQHELSGSLAWNRSDDRGSGRDRITDNYSLTGTWRAAPALQFIQRITHGRRRDEELDVRSRSYEASSRVQAAPWASLSINAHRTDRWVDREAGTGFERFNDSSLDILWSPVPLVQFSSNSRYQERDTREWDTRQGLTWRPFPGGKLETTVSGDMFYDSRVDYWQLGTGLRLKWRPRPGLLAEGGIDVRRLEVAGEKTIPVGTNVHLSWSR